MQFDIIPLNEGFYTIGFDKVFYSFLPNRDKLEDRSKGSLLVEIQPFLLKSDGLNVLFDTGLGFKNQETGLYVIDENLEKYQLSRNDIHAVILSHLHKDHAGGLLLKNENEISLRFPNATHFISQKEWNYALNTGTPSYEIDDFLFLKESNKISWLAEKGNIFDFIFYEEDGGHCPHHTSFKIVAEEKIYFFGGDVAPQLKQLQHRYMAKYDFDPRKSMELRANYAELGKKENWHFMFYHDTKIPIAEIKP